MNNKNKIKKIVVIIATIGSILLGINEKTQNVIIQTINEILTP